MRIVLGSLAAVGFLAALVWVTFQQAQARCEVCMQYRGRQICETATAADRDHAVAQARSSACARLASGVTDGIRCNGGAPLSVSCD
jgi:hypothetical protein